MTYRYRRPSGGVFSRKRLNVDVSIRTQRRHVEDIRQSISGGWLITDVINELSTHSALSSAQRNARVTGTARTRAPSPRATGGRFTIGDGSAKDTGIGLGIVILAMLVSACVAYVVAYNCHSQPAPKEYDQEADASDDYPEYPDSDTPVQEVMW